MSTKKLTSAVAGTAREGRRRTVLRVGWWGSNQWLERGAGGRELPRETYLTATMC